MVKLSPLQRFTGKVRIDTDSGCWEWSGYRNRDGYPKFWDGEKMVLAHRWILEQVAGPLAEGDEADHLCRNRCCTNPCHLESVSSLENKLRIFNANRRSATHIERDLTALTN